MNKRMPPLFPMMILVFGLGLSLAQEEKIPPPKEPVLARAPSRAEWTIRFSFDLGKAKAAALGGTSPQKKEPDSSKFTGFPVEIQISKDGTTYREIAYWPDGSKIEKWIVDGFQLQESRDGKNLIRLPAMSFSPDVSDYSRSDFENVEWVGLDNYTGPEVAKSPIAYEFSVTAAKKRLTSREEALIEARGGGSEASRNPDQRYTAYLDIKTQLPLYADNGTTACIYKFAPAPSTPLTVPSKFAQEFAAWKNLIRKRTLPPPLPP